MVCDVFYHTRYASRQKQNGHFEPSMTLKCRRHQDPDVLRITTPFNCCILVEKNELFVTFSRFPIETAASSRDNKDKSIQCTYRNVTSVTSNHK